MAYSNGQIYVDTSVTPNKGVSIRDLQQCFGISSNDLGTLIKTIGEDEIINKWARYKPQRNSTNASITHDTRKGLLFGLNVPFCANDIMNGLVYAILDDPISTEALEAWSYLYPRGKAVTSGTNQHENEYYRLTDFVRTPNDSTDPYNGTGYAKGYNHNAKVPFFVSMQEQGVTEIHDSSDNFLYYQVNVQQTNTLTFNFINSIGDDIHLQDLIDTSYNVDGKAWRPILQVFKDSGTSGNYWYQRTNFNINNGDKEYCGDAIGSNDIIPVSLDLNAAPFYVNGSYVTGNSFHVCIGVGCCKADFTSWKDNNKSLFIAPFNLDELQYDKVIYPFHFLIRLVSSQVNNLKVTQIQWFDAGRVHWYTDDGGGSSSFEIGVNATSQIRLTMTYTNQTQQNLDFVAQNGSAQSGYTKMEVQALESFSSSAGVTELWLQPADPENNWGPKQHTLIKSTDATKTLYATIDTSTIPAGGYATYHLKSRTGGVNFDDIGSFSIYKRRTL